MPPARPPAEISAPEFFERWLPQTYVALGCVAPDDAPLVRVSLGGPGGGEWELEAIGDRLTVEAVPSGPANGRRAPGLWLRQSTADFLATFARDPDLPELLPPDFGPLELMFLDGRDVEMLKQIDGRLAVEMAGRRRRRWMLDLAVGKAGLAAGRPRATVKLDAATYEGLRSGSLPPLKALLERKISVEGDRALAMQALMLLGARLTRG